MPSFASHDAIVTALTSGNKDQRSLWKNSQTADAVGVPVFSWRGTGVPGAGAVPATGSGTIPTKDTAGAMFMANPGGAQDAFMTNWGMGGATLGAAWLIDVCWFNSGLSGTVITAQTINSTALTRYTTGADLHIALICWTATGTTASNVTLSYTNQAGTTGRTTTSVALWTGGYGGGALAPTADQVQLIPLQLGDTGVRAIASLTLSASTTTAGNFGAMIFKKLAEVTWIANSYTPQNLELEVPSLPERIDDACLGLLYFPSATSTGINRIQLEAAWAT